jgi:hypothetical protein
MVNSDYVLKQQQPADLCNGKVLCFLCGTDSMFNYYLDELCGRLVLASKG